MGPLTSAEMAYDIPTSTALMHGTLPGVLGESSVRDREKTLRSYAAIYLREEVQAESLTRSLEGFARFLTAIGAWAGAHLDLAKIATAAQVSRMSAGRWLEVLEDTLLVHRVDAFAKSATRRLVQHPKVFFFDVGVLNGLLGNFVASPDRIGRLFEHLVYTQLVHSAAAFDDDVRVSTFRTEHGGDVDFIVERGADVFAIEVKASLRMVTHPRVLRQSWTSEVAGAFLAELQQSSGLFMLVPTDRHAAVLAEVMSEVPLIAGNLWHDAETAVLMRAHGIRRICTRDTDFARFPFVEIVDPLTGEP